MLIYKCLYLFVNSVVCGVVALGAEVICARVPGLTPRQREMCRTSPDAMVAVGDGVRLATEECRYQFRHQRWNCSAIGSGNVFGHVVVVGQCFFHCYRHSPIMYMIS